MEIITKCLIVYDKIYRFNVKPGPNDKKIVFIKNNATVQISKIKFKYKTRIKMRDFCRFTDLIILDHREYRILEMSSKNIADYAPGEITDIICSY